MHCKKSPEHSKAPNSKPLPPGEYIATIISAEKDLARQTREWIDKQSGTTTAQELAENFSFCFTRINIDLTLRVENYGTYRGYLLRDTLHMDEEKRTGSYFTSVEKLYSICRTLGAFQRSGDESKFSLSLLFYKPLMVTVGVDCPDEPTVNEIKKYSLAGNLDYECSREWQAAKAKEIEEEGIYLDSRPVKAGESTVSEEFAWPVVEGQEITWGSGSPALTGRLA